MEAEVVEDTVVDHHQVLVVDTEEDLALVDQEVDTVVDRHQVAHQEDLVDTMVKAEKEVHRQEDTHLLVVMTTEVEDTEVAHHQDLVVDTRVDKVVDLDTEVLRVEATEVTHSVIALALLDTASHDHLSLEEMHLTMHTLSEVNNSFIQKRIRTEYSVRILFCYFITHSVLSIAEKCVVSWSASSACMNSWTPSGLVSFLLSM